MMVRDRRYGIKFTHDNPPPGYRGPEVETIRQALARLRAVLLSRIPARGVSAVSILKNESVHTPGDLMIRLAPLIALRPIKDNKALLNVTSYKDEPAMITTSHFVDVEGNGDIFTPNVPIAILAPNQTLQLEVLLTIGDKATHSTGYSPVTICCFNQTADGYNFEFELMDGVQYPKEIYELAVKISEAISKEL